MTKDGERRRHFRIRYPDLGRPVLLVEGHAHAVSELSEGGMRIMGEVVKDPPAKIIGSLQLLHGETMEIIATFGRVFGEEAIYVGVEGVSFAAVMQEQRYLVKRYPGRY